MCIAVPMEVIEAGPMTARCRRGKAEQLVDCGLTGALEPGSWVLVFQERAIRVISAEEAQETLAALAAASLAMTGEASEEDIRAGFADLIDREPELPPHLRTLAGQHPAQSAGSAGQA